MSWTDERIATLRKMWLDGMSASQIAAELENGITRNAVIGKVHRLGLSGRAKAPSPQPPRKASVKPALPTPNRAPSSGPISHGATALAYQPEMEALPQVLVTRDENVVSMSEHVTMMDLRESMCRWPLGDPARPDFRFCGSKSPPGASYCSHHAQLAYQPVHDRRRDRDRRLPRIA